MTLVLQRHPLSGIPLKEALPELAPFINFFTMNDWNRFKEEYEKVHEENTYEPPIDNEAKEEGDFEK